MKRKLTYKQRLIYVLAMGTIFTIVLYNLAISNTIALASEHSLLEEQISKNQNAPKQIKTIQQKLNKIQQLIGSETSEEIDLHQVLLESITHYVQKNKLILKDFPQPYTIVDKGYITNTTQATVEGEFIDLLKLIYYLEHDYNVGKVVAVNFKITKELRSRRRKLTSVIYLQNVKTQNNE